MITSIRFIDRREELESLRRALESERFELVIVYGRRRIGKTRLVLEAIRDRDHVYYLAVEADNLRHFRNVARRLIPEIEHAREDWESYLMFLKDKIIVIDEFPNLIREDRGVLSKFQRAIDTFLKDTRTKIILLGSSISMMTDILSYSSPLYGRRTSSLKLGPMDLFDIRGFFESSSWRELVEIYGFADGIPYYLERVRTPFWRWLEEEISKPDTFLKDEIDFLMRYEFAEVSTYKRILEALARGKRTPKEIRDWMGARHSDITPYLRNLMEVGLIVRESPITEGEGSRRTLYRIADNFVSFWFRYIYPNLSAIEEGLFEIDEIKRDYDSYLGQVFERIARQLLVRLMKRGEVPRFEKIGRWWSRKGEEIDILALSERKRRCLLIEVKWSDLSSRDVGRLLGELEKRFEILGLDGWKPSYGLVARKIEGKDEWRREGVLAYDLDDFDLVAS